MLKYTHLALASALLLLATLTACPIKDSDDDSGESGTCDDNAATAASTGSSGTSTGASSTTSDGT